MGNQSNKTVSIIGLGYVGLPLALLLGRKGYKVTGVDINSERVESLNKRIAQFADQEITEQLRNASFEATMDFSRIKDVGVIIICVPTPVYANHMPNLEPVQKMSINVRNKGPIVDLYVEKDDMPKVSLSELIKNKNKMRLPASKKPDADK